jgi:hypothetical protein
MSRVQPVSDVSGPYTSIVIGWLSFHRRIWLTPLPSLTQNPRACGCAARRSKHSLPIGLGPTLERDSPDASRARVAKWCSTVNVRRKRGADSLQRKVVKDEGR